MKRLTGLESILHQARRGLDPLSGRLLERAGFEIREATYRPSKTYAAYTCVRH